MFNFVINKLDSPAIANQGDVEKVRALSIDVYPKEVLKTKSVRQIADVEESGCVENEKPTETKGDDEKEAQNNDWKLSDFQNEKRLGYGRFGKVYLVHEKSTKYVYAMKKQTRDPMTEILVWREIGIQRELCHKNILRSYGYFFEDAQIYLILEYAPYGNLRKKLDKQPYKRFDEKCAAKYINACADALSYLHERDIIHRDIKPENLLLSYNDRLKIADFGLSVNAQNQRRRTICGTPDYLPPEIMNGEPYSKEVDLWSLGVLSYDLLVGEWAFCGSSKENIYWKTIRAKFNPFPDFLSQSAGNLIKRLIVVNPECRLTLFDVQNHPWIIANNMP
ncbi:aurora kinase C-like [Contarinia nasturtii]|uniref:aurora kinase C-like n=1 Tax=Contarinia nasturtii TaxID=265458 RepID=UPI0012D3B2BE|nr:aurora kinase C-like [Contarinia nasturtii]